MENTISDVQTYVDSSLEWMYPKKAKSDLQIAINKALVITNDVNLTVQQANEAIKQLEEAKKIYENAFIINSVAGENYALNKKATASSTINGHTNFKLEFLTDGKKFDVNDIGWTSDPHSVTANNTQWVQVDLGVVKQVGRVDLTPSKPEGFAFPQDFYVEISENGSDYVKVYSIKNYKSTGKTIQLHFGAQNARYVKITGTKLTPDQENGSSFRMQFGEIEVFPMSVEEAAYRIDSVETLDNTSTKIVLPGAPKGFKTIAIHSSTDINIIGLNGNVNLPFSPQKVYLTFKVARDSDNSVGYTKAIEVNVPAKELTGISIKTLPQKLVYTKGEAIDVTGGVLSLNYSDKTSAQISIASEMISGYDEQKVGEQTVEVTYNGHKTSFNVTVNNEVQVPALTGISIKTLPQKLVYTKGEAIDVTGGVLSLNYSDKTSKEINITSEMIVGYDKNKLGKQNIEVIYENYKTSFDVTVSEKVKSVVLEQSDIKINVGESEKLLATVTLHDGTITNDVIWESANTQIVKVDANGKITALSEGETIIKAVAKQDKTAFGVCNVKVIGKVVLPSDNQEFTNIVVSVDYDSNGDISNETVEEIIAVIKALKDNEQPIVAVYEKTKLKSDVFKALKSKSGGKLVISFQDKKTGKTDYSMTFDAKDIIYDTIDLKIGVQDITALMEGLIKSEIKNSEQIMVFDFAHNGKLPGKATIKKAVPMDKYKSGDTVTIYYINESNKLEKVQDCMVTADGYIQFTLTHCSKYAVIKEASTLPGENQTQNQLPSGDETAKSTVPRTNDGANTGIYVIILICGMGTIFTALILKKNKKTKKQIKYK